MGLKSHLLVKTCEENSLEIIQSSKQVWSKLSKAQLERCGVEIVEGLDEERGLTYEVYAQSGIMWKGLELPLKLAWVREKHLRVLRLLLEKITPGGAEHGGALPLRIKAFQFSCVGKF